MYFIIFILFVFFVVFAWNSTKDFETPVMRLSYIGVGTLFITVLTLIIFQFSRIGINYPKEEMIGEVRKIILLVFIPINGLIILTQSANIISILKSEIITKKNKEKRLKIYAIIFLIMIILECVYFKNIQNGMINFINSRQI